MKIATILLVACGLAFTDSNAAAELPDLPPLGSDEWRERRERHQTRRHQREMETLAKGQVELQKASASRQYHGHIIGLYVGGGIVLGAVIIGLAIYSRQRGPRNGEKPE